MQLTRPMSTDEALGVLADAGEDCTVIAGGTAVMLTMRNGLLHPEHLLPLDRVPGLDTIVGGLRVGDGASASTSSRTPSRGLYAAREWPGPDSPARVARG